MLNINACCNSCVSLCMCVYFYFLYVDVYFFSIDICCFCFCFFFALSSSLAARSHAHAGSLIIFQTSQHSSTIYHICSIWNFSNSIVLETASYVCVCETLFVCFILPSFVFKKTVFLLLATISFKYSRILAQFRLFPSY